MGYNNHNNSHTSLRMLEGNGTFLDKVNDNGTILGETNSTGIISHENESSISPWFIAGVLAVFALGGVLVYGIKRFGGSETAVPETPEQPAESRFGQCKSWLLSFGRHDYEPARTDDPTVMGDIEVNREEPSTMHFSTMTSTKTLSMSANRRPLPQLPSSQTQRNVGCINGDNVNKPSTSTDGIPEIFVQAPMPPMAKIDDSLSENSE